MILRNGVLVLLLLISFGASAELRVTPFSVCNEPNKLFFVLKNVGNEDILVRQDRLPWKYTSDAISFHAFWLQNSKFKPMDGASMIYDGPLRSKEIALHPGRFVYGSIYLDRIVDDFSNKIRLSEIFIFYEVKANGYASGKGLVYVPRRRILGSSCPAVIVGP